MTANWPQNGCWAERDTGRRLPLCADLDWVSWLTMYPTNRASAMRTFPTSQSAQVLHGIHGRGLNTNEERFTLNSFFWPFGFLTSYFWPLFFLSSPFILSSVLLFCHLFCFFIFIISSLPLLSGFILFFFCSFVFVCLSIFFSCCLSFCLSSSSSLSSFCFLFYPFINFYLSSFSFL